MFFSSDLRRKRNEGSANELFYHLLNTLAKMDDLLLAMNAVVQNQVLPLTTLLKPLCSVLADLIKGNNVSFCHENHFLFNNSRIPLP